MSQYENDDRQQMPYYTQQVPYYTYPYYYPYTGQQMQPYTGQMQTFPFGMPSPTFAPQMPTTAAQTPVTASQPLPGMLPLEESYIENILRLNKGKVATVYMTFENNREWNAKIFRGRIEAAGRDHLILSDPQTGMRYLLPMIYLDYVTFDEEIVYEYPFADAGLSTYAPR
jgi:spore germination protein Q